MSDLRHGDQQKIYKVKVPHKKTLEKEIKIMLI